MLINERIPEGLFIEGDVDSNLERYLAELERCCGSVDNVVKPLTEKHIREKKPEFANSMEKKEWEDREIDRCINGHGELSGKHYYHFNYGHMKTRGTGRLIRPAMRRLDAEILGLCEDSYRGDRRGRGLLTVKGRTVGASVDAAADTLHECTFYPYTNIGINSKDLEAVEIFLDEKIGLYYDGLETFIKPTTESGSSKQRRKFSKTVRDKEGNKIQIGTMSMLLVKAPTKTAWESWGMKGLKIDEGGKIKDLVSLVKMSLPCLADDDGISRAGFLWIFGTAGDIDNEGAGLKYMVEHAAAFDLDIHLVPGWARLMMDDLGNENIPEAVRWILNRRQKLKDANMPWRDLLDEVQQYPLTLDEAFLGGAGSFFDEIIVNNRIKELKRVSETTLFDNGAFQWDVPYESVIWRPHPHGVVSILEHPCEGVEYSAGNDPYDIVKKAESGSSGANLIMKPPMLVDERTALEKRVNKDGMDEVKRKEIALALGDLPVCIIEDDGSDPQEFYEQSTMGLIYFNSAKMLLEKQKGGAFIAYLLRNGLERLMARRPAKIDSPGARPKPEYAYHRDEMGKKYDLSLVFQWHKTKMSRIFFLNLAQRMLSYNPDIQRKKADLVDSFAFCLLELERWMKKKGVDYWNPKKEEEKKKSLRSPGYYVGPDGRIGYVK